MMPFDLGWLEVVAEWEKADRKKKKLDRIIQDAEAAQRRRKGMHFK